VTFGHRGRVGPHTARPPLRPEPNPVEVRCGYGFDGPPTVARLFLTGGFDLIFGTAAIVIAVAVRARVRRCGAAVRVAYGSHAGLDVRCARAAVSPRRRTGLYCLRCFSMAAWSRTCCWSMLWSHPAVLGTHDTCPSGVAVGRTGDRLASGMASGGLAFAVPVPPRTRSVATVVCVAGFYGLYSAAFSCAVTITPKHVFDDVHFLLTVPLLLGCDRTTHTSGRIPQLGKGRDVFASLPLHAFFWARADGHGEP